MSPQCVSVRRLVILRQVLLLLLSFGTYQLAVLTIIIITRPADKSLFSMGGTFWSTLKNNVICPPYTAWCNGVFLQNLHARRPKQWAYTLVGTFAVMFSNSISLRVDPCKKRLWIEFVYLTAANKTCCRFCFINCIPRVRTEQNIDLRFSTFFHTLEN